MSFGPSPASRGRIEIGGIRAYGKHGANPGEREASQPFTLDIVLHVDLGASRRSDDLADTIDYAAVAARAVEIVRERSFRLLERLGDEILSDLLRDERVAAASVKIAKPQVLAGATPAVTLFAERTKSAGALREEGARREDGARCADGENAADRVAGERQ